MLTGIQHHSFVGWPPRRLAVFVLVVEHDDSGKHYALHLYCWHEVRVLSLGNVYGLTPPSGWLGLLALDDRGTIMARQP